MYRLFAAREVRCFPISSVKALSSSPSAILFMSVSTYNKDNKLPFTLSYVSISTV